MEAKSFLVEVALTADGNTNKIFNYSLSQVFTPSYVSKIEGSLNKEIKVKEVMKSNDVVAYQQGDTIYINRPVFYSKSKDEQMKNLLHEFIHILQTSKGIIFSKFRELNVVSRKLYKIVVDNLTKPMSIFLTGKNVKMLSDSAEEILAYMMSGTIDWSAIKPEGKRAFIEALQESGIFNLQTKFWSSRLS